MTTKFTDRTVPRTCGRRDARPLATDVATRPAFARATQPAFARVTDVATQQAFARSRPASRLSRRSRARDQVARARTSDARAGAAGRRPVVRAEDANAPERLPSLRGDAILLRSARRVDHALDRTRPHRRARVPQRFAPLPKALGVRFQRLARAQRRRGRVEPRRRVGGGGVGLNQRVRAFQSQFLERRQALRVLGAHEWPPAPAQAWLRSYERVSCDRTDDRCTDTHRSTRAARPNAEFRTCDGLFVLLP